MANYNKAFNFRNGVQVDVDKFIVRGSLVGIGTSIPGEIFDVNGNVRVAGLVTTRDMNVTGVATFNQVRVGSIQLSASAGVVTATAFYGDGATLSNLPTSQWVDVDVGLGFTSIYAAGNVGVNTLDPRFSLQVGANPLDNLPGVGINSNGNIITTGIVSALSFAGAGFGITSLNASNFSAGLFPSSLLPVIPNDKLGPNLQLGIITATNQFVGNLTGIAQSASSLIGNINVVVGFVTSVNLDVGIISAQNAIVMSNLGVGMMGTAFNANSSGKVGIGTTTSTADLQIRKRSNSILEVISETNVARIAIGQSAQSVGFANSSAVIRFGSSPKELDILNNDTGDINMYIHAGGPGINTGRFNWVYGQDNTEKMSLTYDGSLGLGITNPSSTLHVVGTSTVTGNSSVGGNLNVSGNIRVLGSASINISDQILQNVNLNNITGISTLASLRLNGILTSTSSGYFQTLGINTTTNAGVDPNVSLNVLGPAMFRSTVGFGTTVGPVAENTILPVGLPVGAIQVFDNPIAFYNSDIIANFSSSIGIGSFRPKCVVDFSRPGATDQANINYMLAPFNTTAQRNALSLNTGALHYNTNLNAPEIYNGSRWLTITHTDGNAANAGFATVSRQAGISSSAVSASGVVDVASIRATGIATVGTGITMNSGNTGVITARGGFASGIGTAPTQIYVSGNRLVFNVVGIGSTSFLLS